MGELEEKLNSILSSPKDMEKIMEIARGLSGAAPKQEEAKTKPPFGELDPKMLGVMTRLMKEYTTTKSDKTALLSAMKPYVKSENRGALDKANEILKLTRIAKVAFSEFGGAHDEQV